MTLARIREPVGTRPRSGGGFHRNAVGRQPGAVQRERGQGAVVGPIQGLALGLALWPSPGHDFANVGR